MEPKEMLILIQATKATCDAEKMILLANIITATGWADSPHMDRTDMKTKAMESEASRPSMNL